MVQGFHRKAERLLDLLLDKYPDSKALVFVDSKKSVDMIVTDLLRKEGIPVEGLHGGKTQCMCCRLVLLGEVAVANGS